MKRKSTIAKKIVTRMLEAKGYTVITPEKGKFGDGADKIVVKGNKIAMLMDVRAKARLNQYDGSGFDLTAYNEYKQAERQYKYSVYVVFVDEELHEVYGNYLYILDRRTVGRDGRVYPLLIGPKRNIKIFCYGAMEHLGTLSEEEARELQLRSRRNYPSEIQTFDKPLKDKGDAPATFFD